MLAVDLDPETEARLHRLAAQGGGTAEELARTALRAGLDDMEDATLATERLQQPERTYSAEEVKRELGL